MKNPLEAIYQSFIYHLFIDNVFIKLFCIELTDLTTNKVITSFLLNKLKDKSTHLIYQNKAVI